MEVEMQALQSLLGGQARGFFRSDEPVFVGRAPGRLDVMGGVADYSGSVVLESPIASAALVAIQRRSDRTLRVWTLGPETASLVHPQVEISLDDFWTNGALKPVAAVREVLRSRDARWAGYILGAFYILKSEGDVPIFEGGADLLVYSTVPMGAGVASSAALEVATTSAVERAFGLHLDDMRFARLCQLIENQVVGAPCGIMDQVTCSLGQEGRLLALRCQPHDLMGYETVPAGARFVGIDSGVKHSVGASKYVRARVGAFMGLKIITQHMNGRDSGGYLCNITPAELRARYYSLLPGRIRGADFLARYGDVDDPATTTQADMVYSVRGSAEHAIYENSRVQRFAALLKQARRGDTAAQAQAGRLMYGSHWSYSSRIGLGAPETNLLVRIARQHTAQGVLGAKITGGGSGGTVAVMLDEAAAQGHDPIASIAREYEKQRGITPRIIDGTSPGARQWGVRILS
jgi:galactokinase